MITLPDDDTQDAVISFDINNNNSIQTPSLSLSEPIKATAKPKPKVRNFMEVSFNSKNLKPVSNNPLATLMAKEKKQKIQAKQASKFAGTYVLKSAQDSKRIVSGSGQSQSNAKEKLIDKSIMGKKRKKVERILHASGSQAQYELKLFLDTFLEWGCYTGNFT